MLKPVLNKVVNGEHLSREEAKQAMGHVMEGEATSPQIASLITALRVKGETAEEITGFAQTMRAKALQPEVSRENLIDTCGTGGDGGKTFNISTATAIVAAASGARVAKHGNRAVSSKSGSADVLEELGLSIQLTEKAAVTCLEQTNLCFLFAPQYHQAMKHAVGPRKEIGFRTVFNVLGPLTNPAGADRQLIGVFDPSLTETLAEVLKNLGTRRAMVVASDDGLDEISVSAATKITELNEGTIRTYRLSPEDVGLKRHPLSEITGGSVTENAHLIRSILEGEKGASRDIVVLNTAAVLYLTAQADSLQEGVRLTQERIDSGEARKKLDQLIEVSRGLSHAS